MMGYEDWEYIELLVQRENFETMRKEVGWVGRYSVRCEGGGTYEGTE
jgi:hypothetical protein